MCTCTEINKETVENLEQFDETSVNFNIEDTVKEEEVHETTVQLTDVEIYKNFLDSYNVEIVSSPKQISKNKKFASAFSIKCTQDGNPAVNVVVTVKYPVEQINGNVVFGQTNIETDENGKLLFHTKGIANLVQDPVVSEDQIYGKVICELAPLSFVYKIITTKWGMLLCVIFPLMFIIGAEILATLLENEEEKRRLNAK